MARTMKHQAALLLGCLGWHEPHVGSGDRLLCRWRSRPQHQQRTHAPHQTASLFDYRVGASEATPFHAMPMRLGSNGPRCVCGITRTGSPDCKRIFSGGRMCCDRARAAETIASSPKACRSTDFRRGIEGYPGDQRQLREAHDAADWFPLGLLGAGIK